MNAAATWIVYRDRFPLAGPGAQLGFVDASDRAEATRAAAAKYGARVIVVKATKADNQRAAGAAGETR